MSQFALFQKKNGFRAGKTLATAVVKIPTKNHKKHCYPQFAMVESKSILKGPKLIFIF